MDSYLETWASGTSQISKSALRDTVHSTSASNITGRKLNSYLNLIKNNDSEHPIIVEMKTNRLKSKSKSPARSTSYRYLKSNKNKEKSLEKSFSPPRRTMNHFRDKSKNEKSANKVKKTLLKDCSNVIFKEKPEISKKNSDEMEKKNNLKEKLEKVNKKIREHNAKSRKKARKEKNCKKENSSSRENDKIRAKIRAEREISRQAGRKAIGLEHFSHLKVKKHTPDKIDKSKGKSKSPDPSVKKFIKQKKKTQKLYEIQKNLEETLKERDRLNALEKLDRKTRRKKSKKRSKLIKTEETTSFQANLQIHKKRPEKKPKKKQNFRISSDCLSEKLKDLQERINYNYDLLKVKAATKIQNWFRQILYKQQQANDWSMSGKSEKSDTPDDSPNTKFTDSLLERTNQTNLACTVSSFQLKRPKELNIDCIISPLVTYASESPSATEVETRGQALSPTFNQSLNSLQNSEPKSPYTESLFESPVQVVNIETSFSQPVSSGESVIKDPSLHSFSVKKIENFQLSDKDSLENDISEISSALVKTNLDESNKFDEVKDESEDYKIPLGSPNFSYSASDVCNEILENELNLFVQNCKFVLKEKDVDPSIGFIYTYLNTLFDELYLNEEDFLEIVNTPGFIDPLSKLALLQNTDVGELPKRPALEIILPSQTGLAAKEKLANGIKAREIYMQLIFDCINEALNYVRPFGLSGVPDPWISEPRLLFGEGELKRVHKRVKILTEKWANIRGGIFINDDELEDDKLQNAREERMSQLLCFDVNCEEQFWVDYIDEESQSKLDLADIILDGLLKETVDIVSNFN